MDKPQYYLLEKLESDEKWFQLLDYFSKKADYVEFNNLYEPHNLNLEIASLNSDLIETGKRKNKIYSSGQFFRYRLSPTVREFILMKPYKSWGNYQFEDISLIKSGVEVLATITHEDYIIVLSDEAEKNNLISLGYKFDSVFSK